MRVLSATEAEILGRQWLLIPQGGKALKFLLTPRILSIIVSVLAFIFFWNAFVPTREEADADSLFTGVPSAGSLE